MAVATWLSRHGEGPIELGQEEQLRHMLIADLADSGASEAIIFDEVEQFLRSGRVSANNLNRLRRRVERRAGSQSARLEVGSVAADSDVSYGVMSARLSSRGSAAWHERPQLRTNGGGNVDLCTWSEIAKHSKLLEELEKETRKDTKKSQQQFIRRELLEQMDFKTQQRAHAKAEDLRVFEHQKAEIQRFEANEKAKKDALTKKIIEVNKERDMQTALTAQIRKQEIQTKKEEDRKLVKKVAYDLAREQKEAMEKKYAMKSAMAELAKEWETARPAREEEKRKKIEEERKKVQEFNELQQLQEMRNKQSLPRVRECLTTAPPLHRRRGEEAYSEEKIMSQLHEAIKQKDEADTRKEQTQRSARQNNQDFLVQQIEERKKQRREQDAMKGEQRQAVQSASEAFLEAERTRIEQQRARNIMHRHELEQQIHARRTAPKDDTNAMSPAEKAINRHLISEARELREKVSLMAAQGDL